MTAEDLLSRGYSRALWVSSPERWWLRSDGLCVVSEQEALREVAEIAGGDEEADEDPRPAS